MTTRYYSSIAVDTTISTPILAGTTTVAVAATIGWPLTYPFSLALDYGTALEEIVDVTSISGLTATITRGVDGTVAVAHGVGAVVRHVITARDIRDSNTHINTTSGAGAHGILDVQGYTTTATAAGTTTLTSASTALQFFTGATTQTVVLPVTSTLALGQKFRVVNNSTGNITVQSSGLNTIATVTAGVTMDFYCILITGTTAASWNNNVGGVGTVNGTGALVLATSPTLTTPALGVATATSINGATVPSVADTLVGKATTDVLTNKDLSSSTNTFPASTPAGKNAIINGGMDIWQRGTSSSTNVNYGSADRWWLYYGAGTCTVSQETSVVPTGFRYAAKLTQSSTSTTNLQFDQSIETNNSIPMAGKTVTLSGYVAATASTTITIALNYSTSTDVANTGSWTAIATTSGSPTLTIGTTTYQRIVATYSVPSNAQSLQIQMGTTSIASGTSIYITGVQLELGSTATTFSRAGGSIGGELALCQRYYWRTNSATDGSSAFGVGPGTSTTVSDAVIKNPVTMRIAPTIPDYAGLRVYDSVTATTVSSLVITGAGVDNTRVAATVASGLTQYRPYELIGNSGTSYLGFSAEL